MTVNVQQSIFGELADFLVSQPTLEAIATYQVPSAMQQHIDDLLEKNRETGLSHDERLDLEKILAVAAVLDLAKAKLKLAGKT